jgi:holo-[acyl-carrier protein] synthase
VLRNAHGRPHFDCAPELVAWLTAQGIVAHHLSLSDEGELVLAYAILEKT